MYVKYCNTGLGQLNPYSIFTTLTFLLYHYQISKTNLILIQNDSFSNTRTIYLLILHVYRPTVRYYTVCTIILADMHCMTEKFPSMQCSKFSHVQFPV
jgi:hypothetical protein